MDVNRVDFYIYLIGFTVKFLRFRKKKIDIWHIKWPLTQTY
jgi:hypothetical protein